MNFKQYVKFRNQLQENIVASEQLDGHVQDLLRENNIPYNFSSLKEILKQIISGLEIWQKFDIDKKSLVEKIKNAIILNSFDKQTLLSDSLKNYVSNNSFFSKLKSNFKESKKKIQEITQDWNEHSKDYYASLIPKTLDGLSLWEIFNSFEKINLARESCLFLTDKVTQSIAKKSIEELLKLKNERDDLNNQIKKVESKLNEFSTNITMENLDSFSIKINSGIEFWQILSQLSSYFDKSWEKIVSRNILSLSSSALLMGEFSI